ncbi:MAG: VacB/RNase II family 3'-5' exoribonuclease [Acidobacteria bacterium]|nr:VacB/RNase II family 3'-5' exoribonuclease [Acidobacteriota bacterium]
MRNQHWNRQFKAETRPSPGRIKSVEGRLVCHRDGYGFVIPTQPLPKLQGDIYIGPHWMGSAMHGDLVLVTEIRVRQAGRAEGRIHRILKRAHATIVGTFHFGTPFNYVVPYEEKILHQIVIPKGQEFPVAKQDGKKAPALTQEELEGSVVNVEITRFPAATQNATGRVLEMLGRPGDFGVDVEILIRKYHLPFEFPQEVWEEARAIPQTVPETEIERRRDFRHVPIVTIDGETARDFDDAVAVALLPNGNFELQVHIADVAHYVRPGAALDREARLRGTSVYFPNRAVPMLPPELSNGICSLNPEEDRLVVSVLMEIGSQGEILNSTFCEGVIRSVHRMTYTAVNQALEKDPEIQKRYAGMLPHFERMRDLALILSQKRRRRGSIDFDLPEPVIQFDELGTMRAITRSERNTAHRLIEEFMLAANETVAAYLEHIGRETLHRIHEQPELRKVVEFEQIAATFGYSLGVGNLPVQRFPVGRPGSRGGRRQKQVIELPAGKLEISPRNYQQLTEKLSGKPEERIVSYLMLRSLKQACYRERNEGHFALATPYYTHFTSPIRRYPDLVVHRILKSVLQGGTPVKWTPAEKKAKKPSAAKKQHRKGNKPPKSQASQSSRMPDPSAPGPAAPYAIAPYVTTEVDLATIAIESSEAERRAAEAERELIEWKKAAFMRDKLGEEFDALIISVAPFGFFVELVDLFVEGLVPLETLTDQRYLYREQQQQLVGDRTRRSFRIGNRLRVRLDRIGEPAGKMNFSVAD